MSELALSVITLMSGFLVVYHHALYPLALKWLARKRAPTTTPRPAGTCKQSPLPSVTVIVPAFNEQRWIAEKIRNLAILDYPAERFEVIIACDGCRDQTARLALAAIAEPVCQGIRFSVKNYVVNRGKVALINQLVQDSESDLILLTDVSALLSIDALRLAARHFIDPRVGVVNSRYRLWHNDHAGEDLYWQYQCELKQREASLGSTLGTHGAGYVFRRRLYQPLASDTINDDFILPMQIVAQGYRSIQESLFTTLEMESSDEDMDFKRRIRISAGNLQQLIRLRGLLHPKHGGLAFTFASGKALRVLMPFCMLAALLGSISLAFSSPWFALLALLQLALYGLAAISGVPSIGQHKALAALRYLVAGYLAGLWGSVRYALRLERGRWSRVVPNRG